MQDKKQKGRRVYMVEKPSFLPIKEWNQTAQVVAGFTTRHGGISQGVYASLNLALHVGDEPARVVENRRMIAGQIGYPLENWVAGEQVHGDRVAVIGREERGRGAFRMEDALPACDAMITREKGIVLVTFAADCVPLLFFDPQRKAIGVAHAGWKGTVLKIAQKTVRKMQEAFASRPENIHVVLGPSIGPCCYEVDGKVHETVLAAYADGERFFQESGEGKWRFSLWQANRSALEEAGVRPQNIRLFEVCTSCHADRFYSYRREKQTGRHAGIIVLPS